MVTIIYLMNVYNYMVKYIQIKLKQLKQRYNIILYIYIDPVDHRQLMTSAEDNHVGHS